MRKPILSFLLVFVITAGCGDKRNSETGEQYLSLAIQVANWLEQQKVIKEEGVIWRSSDEQESFPVFNSGLYNGSGGVVLFYLELYHQTDNEQFLTEAKLGADYLLAAIPDSLSQNAPPGLYIGTSGLGFVLGEVYKLTNEDKYLDGVKACVKLLDDQKVADEAGFNWGANTDIISGNTGIGLFLLYAYQDLQIDMALDLAIGAGRSLTIMSDDAVGGKKWMMLQTFPRYMPNFSHGTAGTSYFLAALYEQTQEALFKDASLEGAEHLLSIANDNGLIDHHEPDTTGLVYYGWCHGPTGTGRLYQKLSVLDDKNSKWNDALISANTTMINANLTEEHPDGFWQNVGQCCGSAGVADYFLSLHKITSDPDYLEMSLNMTQDIIGHLTTENDGIKWIHAENRSQPDFLQAQTGYMQGSSGIGMHLLRLNAFYKGKSPLIKFPDSPF